MSVYLSPTEPKQLRDIGLVSSACEKKGVDILIVAESTRVGIQRKTWLDLVSSLGDGRLAGSLPKMDMPVRMVLLEGKLPFFGPDGKMRVRSRGRRAVRARDGHSYVTLRHTRESLEGVLLSLQFHHGMSIVRTLDLPDTINYVLRLEKYLSKPVHKGLSGARKRDNRHLRDAWGQVDANARFHAAKVNFLCASGLGQKTAENLLKATGEKLPFVCTWDREELMRIPLFGPATVDRFLGLFE